MAEKLLEGEFWLPAEFLDEDFFLNESRAAEGERGNQVTYAMESESEEEDYIAGLTRQMAHSFLGEEKVSKVMATSPQSTLSDAGIWSASSRGSPNGRSQVSSPPSTPLDLKNDDAYDLLNAAAGEVGKMKRQEQVFSSRGLPIPLKKPSLNPEIHQADSTYRNYNPILTQQQLQAAQFYQLKHHQMIKQQVSAALNRQNRAVRNNRTVCISPSSWSPIHRQQPGSGMRAVFLNSSGTRRESAGTGVFLPRRAGPQNEARKKPTCSSVLLPARVVQALNLNLEDTELHPRYPGYFSFGNDMSSNRSIPSVHHRRQPPPFISTHEIQLPLDWTY